MTVDGSLAVPIRTVSTGCGRGRVSGHHGHGRYVGLEDVIHRFRSQVSHPGQRVTTIRGMNLAVCLPMTSYVVQDTAGADRSVTAAAEGAGEVDGRAAHVPLPAVDAGGVAAQQAAHHVQLAQGHGQVQAGGAVPLPPLDDVHGWGLGQQAGQLLVVVQHGQHHARVACRRCGETGRLRYRHGKVRQRGTGTGDNRGAGTDTDRP